LYKGVQAIRHTPIR